MTTLRISPPLNFNLRSVLYSHGWSDLLPFKLNEAVTTLHSVIPLSAKKFVVVAISERSKDIVIAVEHAPTLSSAEKRAVKNIVRSMLRIDESFDEFYKLCATEPHLRWVPKYRAGRMLHAPSLFEDVVKMLCTTNCSWSLTKIMVNNLTSKLGVPILDNVFTFPTPEAIAGKSERWLRKEISCGYRAPYLLELCRNLADGKLEIESLRHSGLPTEDLYRKLRSIKGIGHYAAGNLLKLLGRYDYLGIDSWVRKKFSEIHKNGRKISDRTIEKHYHRYGTWRGLVCWMEMTADWHKSN